MEKTVLPTLSSLFAVFVLAIVASQIIFCFGYYLTVDLFFAILAICVVIVLSRYAYMKLTGTTKKLDNSFKR